MSEELKQLEARAKAAEEKAAALKATIDNEKIAREIERAGKAAGAIHPFQLKPFVRCVVREKDGGEYIVAVDDGGNAMSVDDAIAALKASGEHDNLFAGQAKPAAKPAQQGGTIDVRGLSHEQYRRLRKENPAALGLRPTGSRR